VKGRLAPIAIATSLALLASTAHAQTTFGTGCAGASGVTPTLSVSGVVQSGQPWTLTVTAPGGIGLGYLLVGFSNTSASALGGLPLPLDLGALFGDPLWSGCALSIDPSYLILPYTFDPNSNGGEWSRSFPGFDTGQAYMQALNIDPDFVTRIAGVSRGFCVVGADGLAPGMAAIEAGSFVMGSNAPTGSVYNPGADETVHTVVLTEPFWIGRYEVTQAEYEAVVGSNPSTAIGLDLPVETLTWFDARAYCDTLTATESAAGRVPPGYEYRLPTEAEWEYACRAGTDSEFGVGSEVALYCTDAQIASSYHGPRGCGDLGHGTVSVGSFQPNSWGLFDMHGNVMEWCLDSYAEYPSTSVADPFVTGGAWRIARGGHYAQVSADARSACRHAVEATSISTGFGFRIVLAPILTP
jgi:formylglycine-generating enzyme required for sulfatase activity